MRSTGKFIASIYAMKTTLRNGKSVGIMALTENNYIEKVVTALREIGIDNVKWKRLTRKDPQNNLELQFDERGEPRGVEILKQSDKFVGWKIWCEVPKNKKHSNKILILILSIILIQGNGSFMFLDLDCGAALSARVRTVPKVDFIDFVAANYRFV